jgi:mannitol/fructose-specific phosphotransferase system IIA component
MSILTLERIRVGLTAKSKEDAIRQAGELLVQSGCVAPEYVDGMLARETTMSTYLGSGVSIPHGQFENRGQIYQTGISIAQFPQGVEWEDDSKAFLVIGIAASSDDHIDVLARLAEVIEDESLITHLSSTDNPEDIHKEFQV